MKELSKLTQVKHIDWVKTKESKESIRREENKQKKHSG